MPAGSEAVGRTPLHVRYADDPDKRPMIERIAKLYAQGLSTGEVAERTGLLPTTVREYRRAGQLLAERGT